MIRKTHELVVLNPIFQVKAFLTYAVSLKETLDEKTMSHWVSFLMTCISLNIFVDVNKSLVKVLFIKRSDKDHLIG